MHIVHLGLNNFRNYLKLEFDVPSGTSVFWGTNAQGKTNLLESICFIATTRFSRSVPDREIINRKAIREKIPFGNVRSRIQREDREVELEIIMRPKSLVESETEGITAIHKYIKVNGIAQRAADLMGQLNMVIFSPRDIDLISEEPALRRRYLDITNSQIDSQYLRSLQRYNKVISQRNHLLRQVAVGHSHADELIFWDEEMIKSGTYLVSRREEAVARINELAGPIHNQLSAGDENLFCKYICSIDNEFDFEQDDDIYNRFARAMGTIREKELARGQSLIGPHRDDLQFFVNDINIGHYGSRGQQRTVALSMKLAESKYMSNRTGETPVLLLDDVLSELDIFRREHLLETIDGFQQVLITTTDLDRFPSDFLHKAQKFEVRNGTIM